MFKTLEKLLKNFTVRFGKKGGTPLQPQVLSVLRNTGTGGVPPGSSGPPQSQPPFGGQQINQQYTQPLNPMAQVANIFSPKHSEETHAAFQEIKNNEVLRSRETFERHGNSLDVTRTQAGVITAGNSVASPDRIASKCDVCKGYSDQYIPCNICSKSLCIKHAFCFDTPSGPVVVCKSCLKKSTRKWDVWQQMDRRSKNPGEDIPIFPDVAYSVSRLMTNSRKDES